MAALRIIRRRFVFLAVFACFILNSGKSKAMTPDEVNNIEVYQRAGPSVVNLTSVIIQYDSFYRPIPQEGTGSGVIIDEKGFIVTNHHVIQNAQSLEVSLADGSKWPASLVGADPDNDLAVIKIDVPEKKLTVIPMGKSNDLEVGEKILAIGNPFGLGQTLTTGIISSLGRSIQTEAGSIIQNLLQTDAAINPGNSGGPLLNSRGEMIGINTAILSPTGANVGIGFAIPVDTVKRIIPQLISARFSAYGLGPVLFFALILSGFYLLSPKILRKRERREQAG